MASPVIQIKLDVTKISKAHLFKGQKGVYLDMAVWDKPNEYGDGYVTQSISKEARDRGERGEILGNWKYMKAKPQAQTPSAPSVEHAPEAPLPF